MCVCVCVYEEIMRKSTELGGHLFVTHGQQEEFSVLLIL